MSLPAAIEPYYYAVIFWTKTHHRHQGFWTVKGFEEGIDDPSYALEYYNQLTAKGVSAYLVAIHATTMNV